MSDVGGVRSNRTDYTVLGCLSFGAMSGYDIKTLIDGTIGHFWNESYGQIYPSLRRLEREGLVVGRRAGGRRRREYRLTPAGVRELRTWLEQPAQPDVVRYEMSLKLFFGGQMSVDAARAHVRRYRDEQRARLDEYRVHAERLEEESERLEGPATGRPETDGHGPPGLPFLRVVLDGGIRYAEMAVEWCDATLERLASLDAAAYPVEPPVGEGG